MTSVTIPLPGVASNGRRFLKGASLMLGILLAIAWVIFISATALNADSRANTCGWSA